MGDMLSPSKHAAPFDKLRVDMQAHELGQAMRGRIVVG